MAADSIEVSVVTSIDAEEAVAALLERVSGLAPVLYTARGGRRQRSPYTSIGDTDGPTPGKKPCCAA